MASLMILHRTRNRRLPQPCSVTHSLRWQDFAGPLSCLESLGTSRFRVVDFLLNMKLVSRASHLGFTVGFLRFDGLCTAQRFHIEEEEQTCRVGCLDELDSGLLLSLQRMSLVENCMCLFVGTCHGTTTER